MATSTPGASGGQPMQIYYMNKKGVPIGIGTSGISMKFISNQLMTVLMASALWLWNASFVDRQLAGARWVVIIGWLINFAAVPLILLVAFHRPLVQRMAAIFHSGWEHRMRLVKDPEVAALRVNTTLDSYHASVLRLSRHPRQILIQLGLSALERAGADVGHACLCIAPLGDVGHPLVPAADHFVPALSQRQPIPPCPAPAAHRRAASCSITGGCSPRARQAWRSWYGAL